MQQSIEESQVRAQCIAALRPDGVDDGRRHQVPVRCAQRHAGVSQSRAADRSLTLYISILLFFIIIDEVLV